MAEYTARVLTQQFAECALRNPTNWVEFEKARTAIENEYERVRGEEPSHDDSILIRATEDEIVLYFEIPQR